MFFLLGSQTVVAILLDSSTNCTVHTSSRVASGRPEELYLKQDGAAGKFCSCGGQQEKVDICGCAVTLNKSQNPTDLCAWLL